MIYVYGCRAADWTAAGLWILAQISLFVYFGRKLPERLEERWKVWCVRILWWVLLTALQAGQARVPFFNSFLLRILFLFLYVVTVKRCGLFMSGYVTLAFYMVKDICKMVILDMASPVLGRPVTEDPWLNTGSMVLCVTMQFLILRQVERDMGTEGELPLRRQDMAAVLFPAIPYGLIKYLQMKSYTYGGGKAMETTLAVICLMLCVCDLIILLQTKYRISAQRVREEAEALRVRSRAWQEWYCHEQESIQEIRKIYHDMKHHLNYIGSLSDSERIREYIKSIAGDVTPYEMFPSTGNEVIDSVLARSDSQCARLGIRLIPSVNGTIFDFMEPKDLLVIFGNGLDNAREAVSPILEEEKREIVVRADRRRKFGVIRIENHFMGQIVPDGEGLAKSTKTDGERHGYGLKNIRSAAGKYGGEVTAEGERGRFVLTVVIPLGEEKIYS